MTKSTQKKKTDDLVIERVFDAPVEQVWRAWTEPEHVKRWWGPKDFTAPEVHIDFQEGGKYLFCMRSEMGPEQWKEGIWSTGTYLKIVPMEKIVSTDSFSDEEGNIVPGTHYGMDDGFPLELKVTVMFEELKDNSPGSGAGKTKFTLRHEGFPKTEIDLARQGWNESLDKLADILNREKEIAERHSISAEKFQK